MNPKYIANLTPSQRLLQERLIRKSQKTYEETGKVVERPEVSGKETPRSPWVTKFQNRYGYPITDLKKVKSGFPGVDVDTILAKGAAAYSSSGSRPNVSSFAWRFARLASALMGGPASKVDTKELGRE